jgi:hypothetical protein
MPSSAFGFFENKLLTDVDRIIESHDSLSTGKKGKHGLGHLTRGGVILLCAAWELYVEKLAQESLQKILERAGSPKRLPKETQKFLARQVKKNKHELYSLELAGDGWKNTLKVECERQINAFNTPKAGPIEVLLRELVGLEIRSQVWQTSDTDRIDEFVKLRGEIAHNGSDANYVRIQDLKSNRAEIARIAIQLDNQTASYISELFPKPHKAPWNRRKESTK